MPRRRWEPMSAEEILDRLRRAGVSKDNQIKLSEEDTPIDNLDVRLKKILSIGNSVKRKATDMLFFVMYDIESNKVRTLVSKYLVRQGCYRIQHSIFLADLSREKFETIKRDLAEVQACYDNHDSIIVVPIPGDHLRTMCVIGKNIDIDIITHTKNTLFF